MPWNRVRKVRSQKLTSLRLMNTALCQHIFQLLHLPSNPEGAGLSMLRYRATSQTLGPGDLKSDLTCISFFPCPGESPSPTCEERASAPACSSA